MNEVTKRGAACYKKQKTVGAKNRPLNNAAKQSIIDSELLLFGDDKQSSVY